MKLTLNPYDGDSGLTQIGVVWKISTNKSMTEVVETSPDSSSQYVYQVQTLIGVGVPHWFTTTRIFQGEDVDGNPVEITDSPSDPKQILITDEDRNIVLDDVTIPESPMVTMVADKISTDIKLKASSIRPRNTIQKQCHWIVLNEFGQVIQSDLKSGEHMNEFTLDASKIENLFSVKVMCAQLSIHNVLSPYSTTNVDLTQAVTVTSNKKSISPENDHLVTFTLADIDGISVEGVVVKSVKGLIVASSTLSNVGNNYSVLIPSSQLSNDSEYIVTVTISHMEREMDFSSYFSTIKAYVDFIVDPAFKYDNGFDFTDSATNPLTFAYAEESITGLIPSFAEDMFHWYHVSRNDITIPEDTDAHNASIYKDNAVFIRISKRRMLIDGYVEISGQVIRRLGIIEDDNYTPVTTFLAHKDIPTELNQELLHRVNEITFVPNLNSVMYSYTTADGTIMEMMNVDTMEVTVLPPRPDGSARNMVIEYIGNNKVLVAGGNQNSLAYVYDVIAKEYEFISAIPNDFVDTSFITTRRKDGKIALIHIDKVIQKTLVFNTASGQFDTFATPEMSGQYKQVIRTNHDILVTDKDKVLGHLS